MSNIKQYKVDIPRLSEDELAAWKDIPAAVASDGLNRMQAMAGAISPLAPSMRICGQARTVECMVADNSALHAAITVCEPGDVLICDGQGFEDTAIFGGMMTRSAINYGIAGLVLDGAVRDTEEIVELGFACFARCGVSRGPHKGFGGYIDGTISCGGVSVSPGDLIIGDGDGVTVVPYGRIPEALAAAQAILKKEESALKVLADGGTLGSIYGVPEIEVVDR